MEQMAALSDGAFGTTVIEKVTDNEEKISSTRIRKLFQKEMLKRQQLLLGRPFRTVGTVVDGEKRGRLLGFPTANVLPENSTVFRQMVSMQYVLLWMKKRMMVYAMSELNRRSMIQVIDRPSLKYMYSILMEIYMVKKSAVDWIEHIRDEQKFDSSMLLIEQMAKDKNEAAKEILSKHVR